MTTLNVTLTGTTNPYLIPRLPLDGEIELIEIGLHSAIIAAVFRIRDANGNLGAPVEVKEPEFTYQHAAAAEAGHRTREARLTYTCPARCGATGPYGQQVTHAPHCPLYSAPTQTAEA